MFKSLLTICVWGALFLFGSIPAWPKQDVEDHFLYPEYSLNKISMDFKDVPLTDILKIFSKQSNLNFIASPDVADKKITLFINGVPFDTALKEVLAANDLIYEMQEDSNVFVVKAKPKGDESRITKVYQLKYATVSSSKLNSTIAISSGSALGSSSGSSSGPASGPSKGGLEDAVRDALSKDGKLMEDTRTNSLIISDVPQQFEIIENTIAKLDVPVPQILIDVVMVDVSKSTADQLGITYGATPLTFMGGSKNANWPFGANTGPSTNTSSGSGSSSSSSSSSASTPTTGWNANGMTAALNFLSTKIDARTLARPRILTLNNETAQIEISTNAAMSIQQVTSSTTSSTSQTSYTPERYQIGVILKVTPQANLLTHEITMAVSPKVIDATYARVQPPAGSGQGSIYDPETRGSDSILRLKDGQSMVIGGLMNNQDNSTITKLPVLGDLPFIGAAFRSKTKSKSERELVIFLTPHIIDENNHDVLKSDNSYSSGGADAAMKNETRRLEDVDQTLNTYEFKRN